MELSVLVSVGEAVPAVGDVVTACLEVYQQWKATKGLHRWFAEFVKHIAYTLNELKTHGHIPQRALGVVNAVGSLVARGRDKLAKYDERWEITRMLLTAKHEEEQLSQIQRELCDMVGILQLTCINTVINLVSSSRLLGSTASSVGDAAGVVHQHAANFHEAVSAVVNPNVSEYELQTSMAKLQASALDVQSAGGGAPERWQLVLQAIGAEVPSATGIGVAKPVPVKPMTDEWGTRAGPTTDTADMLPSADEARQEIMAGKGNNKLLLFSCPIKHFVYEMRGPAQPMRLRPCGHTISLQAMVDASGSNRCPVCNQTLGRPAGRKDKRMLQILQARDEVVQVAQDQVPVDDYINAGRQGTVVQAQMEGVKVAIKFVAVDYGNVRMLREVWKSVAVCHLASSYCPQVNQLLAVTWRERTVGLVLELCEDTLTDVVRRAANAVCAGPAGGLPVTDLALLLLELTTACTVLHIRAHILHGDIKPDNVMLRNGRPCLIDFGIATVMGTHTATNAGVQAGTAGYAAPEQGECQPTGKMDIYSIAATVVFAAQNKAPFGALDAKGIAKQLMMNRGIKIPRTLPGRMRALLQRMVRLNPDTRPGLEEVQKEAVALFQELNAATPLQFLQPTHEVSSYVAQEHSGRPAGAEVRMDKALERAGVVNVLNGRGPWMPYEAASLENLGMPWLPPSFYAWRWKYLVHANPLNLKLRVFHGVSVGEALLCAVMIAQFMAMILYWISTFSAAVLGCGLTGSLSAMSLMLVYFLGMHNNFLLLVVLGVPFDRMAFWHAVCGTLCIIYSFLHGVTCEVERVELRPTWEGEKHHFLVDAELGPAMYGTGWVMQAFMFAILASVFTQNMTDGYAWFRIIHIVGGVMLTVGVLFHGWGASVMNGQMPMALPGAAFWLVDHLIRRTTLNSCVGSDEATIELHVPSEWRGQLQTCMNPKQPSADSARLVEVRVPANNRRRAYTAGQWVYLNIPSIDTSWHPFMIASADTDTELSLFFPCEGRWTRQVADLVHWEDGGKIEEHVKVGVEGPYGSPMIDVLGGRYKHFLIISAGVGWTMLRAWKRQLLSDARRGRPVHRVHCVALVRYKALYQLDELSCLGPEEWEEWPHTLWINEWRHYTHAPHGEGGRLVNSPCLASLETAGGSIFGGSVEGGSVEGSSVQGDSVRTGNHLTNHFPRGGCTDSSLPSRQGDGGGMRRGSSTDSLWNAVGTPECVVYERGRPDKRMKQVFRRAAKDALADSPKESRVAVLVCGNRGEVRGCLKKCLSPVHGVHFDVHFADFGFNFSQLCGYDTNSCWRRTD